MRILSSFVLLLLMLPFAAGVVGEDNHSAAEPASFVTLKQSDGTEFRAFVAGRQTPRPPS